MIVKVLGRRARVCNLGCADSFREDRRAGAIYGPFGEQQPDGSIRFLKSAEEASLRWLQCCYCGAPVRGRAPKSLPPR